MDTAFLDGQPLGIDGIASDAPVSTVVERAKNALTNRDSILLEVICDGSAIGASALEQTLSAPVSSFSRVELVSGNPRDIVVETLEASRRSIGDTFELVALAAGELNSGSVATGMQRLIDCVDIWSQAHEAMVNSGQLLNLDIESLVIEDRCVLDWLREPAAKLREIRDAIESRDHVMLGDILRYEMDDFLQGWERMLDAYAMHIRSHSKES
jgi:hypothetical protein